MLQGDVRVFYARMLHRDMFLLFVDKLLLYVEVVSATSSEGVVATSTT